MRTPAAFNIKTFVNFSSVEAQENFLKPRGPGEDPIKIRDIAWYLIANTKKPLESTSTAAWERITSNPLKLEYFESNVRIPPTMWMMGATIDVLLHVDLRIPIPVGGSLYIAAPPAYKLACPVTAVVFGPTYRPLCIQYHPVIVGCEKFQQKRGEFFDEIYRLGNVTEEIIFL